MRGPIARAVCAALLGVVGTGILSIHGPTVLGGSLNLQPQDPDLNSGFLTVQYSPSSGSLGTFSVSGYPLTLALSDSGTPYTISTTGTNDYQLTALINENTGQATSGTLDIGGTISPIASSGTLLTGTLANFGASGDVFEFIFNVTGGDLVPYYPAQIGVELTATGSGFTGSFLTPFATTAYAGVADNFSYTIVPEPGAVALMLAAGAFSLIGRKVRRRQSRHRDLIASPLR